MSEAEESGYAEAQAATKKGHTNCTPKVEYAHFLSKINNPQSAYDKLRAVGPH